MMFSRENTLQKALDQLRKFSQNLVGRGFIASLLKSLDTLEALPSNEIGESDVSALRKSMNSRLTENKNDAAMTAVDNIKLEEAMHSALVPVAARKPINLDKTTVITNPTNGTIYKFSNPDYPDDTVTITFRGMTLNQYKFIDVATLCYEKTNGIPGIFTLSNCTFLTKNHVPSYVPKSALSSIMLLEHSQAILCRINSYSFDVDLFVFEFTGIAVFKFDLYQSHISDKISELGQVPVFYPAKRPSYEKLNAIYSQFMKYNKKRLQDQYQMTDGLCHIRAHFVNALLAQYQVESCKVFQLWHAEDWLPSFNQNRPWIYHCAAMVIDENNNRWIWDPWVANKALTTLKDWSALPNSPRPYKILIVNQAIVNSFENGKANYAMYQLGESYFNAFQSVMISAIPNPPEKPIPLHYPFLFFTPHTFRRPIKRVMLDSAADITLKGSGYLKMV